MHEQLRHIVRVRSIIFGGRHPDKPISVYKGSAGHARGQEALGSARHRRAAHTTANKGLGRADDIKSEPEWVAARHEDVHPKVELIAIDQQRVGKVLLYHRRVGRLEPASVFIFISEGEGRKADDARRMSASAHHRMPRRAAGRDAQVSCREDQENPFSHGRVDWLDDVAPPRLCRRRAGFSESIVMPLPVRGIRKMQERMPKKGRAVRRGTFQVPTPRESVGGNARTAVGGVRQRPRALHQRSGC